MCQTTFVLGAELNQKLCIPYFMSVLSQAESGMISHFWLLGKLHAEIDFLNFFIALVKLHIWISRKHGVTPNLSAFKVIVKFKFRTGKYI